MSFNCIPWAWPFRLAKNEEFRGIFFSFKKTALEKIEYFLAGPKGQAQGMQLKLTPSRSPSLPEADILNFGARILKLGV